MNNTFGPESPNPRTRRAFAHTKISQYKAGEATYHEAFEAARGASATRKGRESGFGCALGGVMIDAYARDGDTFTLSCLSPAKQAGVAQKEASGQSYGYEPDLYMTRPGVQDAPAPEGIIRDPIAEGYALLPAIRYSFSNGQLITTLL